MDSASKVNIEVIFCNPCTRQTKVIYIILNPESKPLHSGISHRFASKVSLVDRLVYAHCTAPREP